MTSALTIIGILFLLLVAFGLTAKLWRWLRTLQNGGAPVIEPASRNEVSLNLLKLVAIAAVLVFTVRLGKWTMIPLLIFSWILLAFLQRTISEKETGFFSLVSSLRAIVKFFAIVFIAILGWRAFRMLSGD